MRKFTFRQKIILLAVALVSVMQVLSFVPVLDAVRADGDIHARQAAKLASTVLSDFVTVRAEKHRALANQAAADPAFRDALARGNLSAIRAAFARHAEVAAADLAWVVGFDGSIIVDLARADQGSGADEPLNAARQPPNREVVTASILRLGESLYQIVTAPVADSVPPAKLLLGYELSSAVALEIQALTGFDVSLLMINGASIDPLVSTLQRDRLDSAIASLNVRGRRYASSGIHIDDGADWITLLQPFVADAQDLFVALQMPMSEAMGSYRDIRFTVMIALAVSMLLAISGASWVANMVTKPVDQLAEAARRMCEGVYSEVVVANTDDELGQLAAGFNAMQDAIAERERHIFQVAHHDTLSGLPNRELSVSKLRDLLSKHEVVQVISIAINRFSRLISSLGHRASDDVIQHVAGLLRNLVDTRNLLGHLNGNEFVIAIPGGREQDALTLVEQIGRVLHSGVHVDGANFSLQVTAGVASYPKHKDEAAGLLHRASLARTEAEMLHRQVAAYRVGQEERAVKQIRIIGDFPSAIENDELVAYFQPKISCSTRSVVGAEALVRWNHPELGFLSPYDFVDAIEQAGSIGHLTRWMMRAAVYQSRLWREQGLEIGIAVNISADDLVDEYLPYYLLELTREYQVKPKSITLEVTESAIMHNLMVAMSVVSCIHELGFRLSIDDFGTGQSSLAQLSRLPVDELKIDRSFVINIDHRKHEAIVHATIEMARRLGLSVCAEGIEDLTVIEKLHRMGAKDAQGFAISKPLPGVDFADWHAQWERQLASGPARLLPRAVL